MYISLVGGYRIKTELIIEIIGHETSVFLGIT